MMKVLKTAKVNIKNHDEIKLKKKQIILNAKFVSNAIHYFVIGELFSRINRNRTQW